MPETTQRPSLTERRKAATQQEIALAAAMLFAEHGPEATTAEDIARAAGISLRTFYRYFRTKEDAVAPLLSAGVRDWIEELAAAPAESGLTEALEQAAGRALTPAPGRPAEALDWVRGLLRVMADAPDLLAVWHRVHHASELALIPVLAPRTGADPLEARLAAAAANTAMRVALETWAASEAPAAEAAALAARCLRELTAGLKP
ncbi:TetR family transcriptional regulator [Kitasatospora sp. MMS16-BH015]|uniref:TetR/AcrR family transcriptional regulator n=1 Tax=Kitasatospora sp. MMS16-BH015 TaxID=2018025 RepID=UPI000CA21861|nr:TetR/AcrR family transcriptional regulator [Kitasatospora sp. MMS16-BH015]AUG80955.1 TetR family transcriptional regulator [Kitasatospora sp. MMS16-BH015]